MEAGLNLCTIRAVRTGLKDKQSASVVKDSPYHTRCENKARKDCQRRLDRTRLTCSARLRLYSEQRLMSSPSRGHRPLVHKAVELLKGCRSTPPKAVAAYRKISFRSKATSRVKSADAQGKKSLRVADEVSSKASIRHKEWRVGKFGKYCAVRILKYR